jgi:hypothetical protein
MIITMIAGDRATQVGVPRDDHAHVMLTTRDPYEDRRRSSHGSREIQRRSTMIIAIKIGDRRNDLDDPTML